VKKKKMKKILKKIKKIKKGNTGSKQKASRKRLESDQKATRK